MPSLALPSETSFCTVFLRTFPIKVELGRTTWDDWNVEDTERGIIVVLA